MDVLTEHDRDLCHTLLAGQPMFPEGPESEGEQVKPGTLHNLEDVIAWIYTHDGRIDAWWAEQRRFNATTESSTSHCQTFMQGEIKEIRRDIQSMRKTMYMAMGGASMLGAVVGIAASVIMNVTPQ
jgi:hypothetical protein